MAASGAWAQAGLTAKLHASGMIQLYRGSVELAMIELNAHGPQWKHAPQASATTPQIADLPDKTGRRITGTLPVPNTTGGALRYVQTITTLPQGLRLEYDVAPVQTVKLSGLQLSFNLQVPQYAGKDLTISRPDGEPQIVSLPANEPDQLFQGWGGEGYRVEAGKGTPEAIAIELIAATDIGIQDLRKWEHPLFEIRFPAVSDDAGRDVTPEDRFHLVVTVTGAGPITLTGP
jgi:hypothetical protein